MENPKMAKKPTPATAEDVIVEVIDSLNRDGELFDAGDPASMPLDEAIKLRALGVVSFEDASVAA
jgi:hypothetical protein